MNPNPFTAAGRMARPAFTLVECLVVISIIGLLLAVALPAVQSARESSRLAVCRQNLRQVGVALAAHHAVQGRFPAAMRPSTSRRSGLFAAGPGFSAFSQILVHLDQTALYNAINFEDVQTAPDSWRWARSLDAANATALRTTLAVLLCPSDRASIRPGCSYRACTGALPYESPSVLGPGGGGAFPSTNALSARDFSDGLSAVVGFSERTMGSGGTPARADRDISFRPPPADAPPPTDPERFLADCGDVDVGDASLTEAGRYWLTSGYEETMYNHVLSPNPPRFDCAPGVEARNLGTMKIAAVSARSSHPGTVSVLMMDGGVHVVRDSLAASVWRAIATRDGGEALSNDAY